MRFVANLLFHVMSRLGVPLGVQYNRQHQVSLTAVPFQLSAATIAVPNRHDADGKNLYHRVEAEVSGNYKKVLLGVCKDC